ncbi:STM3941 family protein [Mesorhizobium sp. CO1-1-8]|uniref:STM3941 family protein n=1 Tax=Mesorhizobium sp. CO1-1-8 TaxID=2876631 RepID=UPI001CD05760|nr:STM3941 family protein [Mesorhizobium sp. CO1-1-8]MBZ9771156.1 hypothetical protein [Mesorhizobium sp. CO1-1-8]
MDCGEVKIDVTQIVEFSRSPLRLTGLVILGAFTCTVSFLFAWPMLAFVSAGSFNQFLGWMGVLLFGAHFLHFLWALISPNQTVVIIAPAGFKDRRIAPEFIAWTSIEKLSAYDYRGYKMSFVIGISEVERRKLSTTLKARWDRINTHLAGLSGLWVVTNDLDVHFGDIFRLVTEYTKAYGGKVD